MPIPQGITVQNPTNISFSDGDVQNQIGGKQAEAIVAELHGKYYTQTYRGHVFHGATASAGVLLPIFSGTAVTFAVWNPIGSGVNVVPIRATAGFVSTTGAAGNILYTFQTGVGSNAGTGAPITAATLGTAQNGLLGGGAKSAVNFIPATATLATANSILKPMGVSQLVTTATTATLMYSQIIDDFDGSVIIPPGAIFAIQGNIALLSLFNLGMTWYEAPL